MIFKRYADDYENEITVDEKGREIKVPVYHGKFYKMNLDLAGISRFKKIMFLLVVLIVGFHIGAGFVNNSGMNQIYVAVPYVVAFFSLVYLIDGVLRLPTGKLIFRRDEIGLSFERMRTSTLLLIIIVGIGILGEIFYIALLGENNLRDLSFLFLELLTVFTSYSLVRLHGKIQVSECNREISETQTK